MKKLFGDGENTAKPRASEARSISLDYKAKHHGISSLEDLGQLPIAEVKPGDWNVVSFLNPDKFLDNLSARYWAELNKPHHEYVIHKLCLLPSPPQKHEEIIKKISVSHHIDEIDPGDFLQTLSIAEIQQLSHAINESKIKKLFCDYYGSRCQPEQLIALFEGLSGNQSLVALDLTQTYLNNESVFNAFLTMVKTLPNLKVLTLCGSAIKKEHLPKLTQALPTLKHLIQLDLRENQRLSAKDCYALAISIPSLKRLGSDDTYSLRRLNRVSKCDIQFFDENLFEQTELGRTYLDFDLPNSKPEGPQNK